MNRDRRNSFGRRPNCAGLPSVPPGAGASQLPSRPDSSTGEAEVTGREPKGRIEALGFIICRLDELRHMAASHGLETLGCFLDVAFAESCDVIRRERSSAEAQEDR